MLKYKIGLLTKESNVYCALRKQLEMIFGKYVEVIGWCVDEDKNEKIESDLIIATNDLILNEAKSLGIIDESAKTYIIKRTMSLENLSKLERILRLKHGTKVAVCGNMMESSIEITKSLKSIGINHLELIPYCRGCNIDLKGAKIALIFGYANDEPLGMDMVIDFGIRVIDISTIIIIIQELGIKHIESDLGASKYIKSITSVAYNLARVTESSELLNKQLDRVLDLTVDGFLMIDNHMNITQCNHTALTAMNFKAQEEVIGKNLKSVAPSIANITDNFFDESEISKIIALNGIDYYVEWHRIEPREKPINFIILLRKLKNIQTIEMSARQKQHQKNFIAKYTFADILSVDSKIKNLINYAKEAASSKYNIAIYGDTGTGKEVFAQAIHNFSKRSKGPFVPVNINTLQDNLIESELFGYAEGSFTGAKKGGKPGLFEIAHKGTLFLDEIGDLSHPLQTKLLRVIQEREVVRVGGLSASPIDIRLIVATNRNLFKMVNEGKFRSDLYFRINVLPIHLPPLWQRTKDIQLLLEHFLNKNGISLSMLSEETKGFLFNYKWPGNIRELQNICIYIACLLEVGHSSKYDIYEKLLSYIQGGYRNQNHGNHNRKEDIISLESSEYFPTYIAILSKFNNAKNKGIGLNRIILYHEFQQQISMQQLKKHIDTLVSYKLIKVGKTKQGTNITREGLSFLENYYS